MSEKSLSESVEDDSDKELGKRVDKIKSALNNRCDAIQSQLDTLRNYTKKNIEDINLRLDRLRKCVSDIVDEINDLDKALEKSLTEVIQTGQIAANNVENIRSARKSIRQVATYAHNLSTKITELGTELKKFDEIGDEFHQFRWKFTVGVSTIVLVVGWFLSENHLNTFIEFVKDCF